MNHEGAQTYLRLLAEAQLREPAMASWGGMMAGRSAQVRVKLPLNWGYPP